MLFLAGAAGGQTRQERATGRSRCESRGAVVRPATEGAASLQSRDSLGAGGVRCTGVEERAERGKTGLRDIYERERQRGMLRSTQTRRERGQQYLPRGTFTSPLTCQNTCQNTCQIYMDINRGKGLAERQFAAELCVFCVFSSPFVFTSPSWYSAPSGLAQMWRTGTYSASSPQARLWRRRALCTWRHGPGGGRMCAATWAWPASKPANQQTGKPGSRWALECVLCSWPGEPGCWVAHGPIGDGGDGDDVRHQNSYSELVAGPRRTPAPRICLFSRVETSIPKYVVSRTRSPWQVYLTTYFRCTARVVRRRPWAWRAWLACQTWIHARPTLRILLRPVFLLGVKWKGA